MRKPDFSAIGPRQALLLIAALALVALAWSGGVDRFSGAYLDDALTRGGVIYATARGINALVSVLQGTEFTPWLFSFSLGEVLDPINDLIERFSAVLLVALASLALQKLLLVIVADRVFNILLSALAFALGCCSLWRAQRGFRLCLQLFLLAACLRFALALAAMASGYVDEYFLREREAANRATLENMQGELQQLSSATATPTAQGVEVAEQEISALESQLQAQRDRLQRDRAELAELQAQLDTARAGLPALERWNPLGEDRPEVAEARAAVETQSTLVAALDSEIGRSEERLAQQRERLQCLQLQLRGEDCGLAWRTANLLSPAQFSARVDALEAHMSEFAASTIDLLVALLLKSIVIPLLFLYALLTVYRVGMRRLLGDPRV
ncbi:hypothetical protein E4634_06555 [Mangrovimicrobium sediminis]|uniref:Uncharacterized protein n=1 Tax=Mangrovimicrobium sediminis TaxID=2562682 RepID=A0A4Z0M5S5_9GAMM|nr:hypothetical protein [Haliea sp. SAOS-164]TGD74849.1 hypothetical protein E4634_06555 [Haliea sp. SAOS-164]